MTQSVAALLEQALSEAAGVDAHPTSLTIDYGPSAEPGAATDGPPTIRAWVERATRSLVFVQGEARRSDGGLAATAAGVFRRTATGEATAR